MKSRKVGARLDQGLTADIEGREKMVAYSTPITPAPITARLRGQLGQLDDLVGNRTRSCLLKGT